MMNPFFFFKQLHCL